MNVRCLVRPAARLLEHRRRVIRQAPYVGTAAVARCSSQRLRKDCEAKGKKHAFFVRELT